uniref:Uncharacterized protein n=1 Tax=Timema monikensis TaxID=170555 RepID=A0A7R9EDD6_9NEOP|nr:unnamed protein product [Timema monikensis]
METSLARDVAALTQGKHSCLWEGVDRYLIPSWVRLIGSGDQEDHEIDPSMRSHKEAVESSLLAADESDEECADDNEVDPEIDGELQIITECWIEPQFGTVMGSPPERIYMENLQYHQLADVDHFQEDNTDKTLPKVH